MTQSIIHFTHGNGFPGLCYRQMLLPLQTQFECHYIDKIGHNPKFPVTENWDYLVQEVIASIRHKSDTPVIAVGHSLGGILNFLAAIQEPQLFKQIILLDSPIIGRLKSNLIWMSKVMGMIDLITPAMQTRGRRKYWATYEEAMTYLQSKPLFQHFTPECLHDYLDYGLQKDSHGYLLRFDSETEYQIYRTLPHVLYRYIGQLKIPTAILYGKKSRIVGSFDVRHMEKNFNINSYPVKGTHMFPMEYPEATAETIMQAIKEIGVLAGNCRNFWTNNGQHDSH